MSASFIHSRAGAFRLLSTGNWSRFTLHYLEMMNWFKRLKVISISFLMLAACSSPPENGEKANNNSAQQKVAATSQPPVAQDGTPAARGDANASTPQSPAAQSAPAQAGAKPADATAKTGEKGAATGRAPKLLVPDKKLDFGKQPQDKVLARTFQIKNVGNANLQIESVTPG